MLDYHEEDVAFRVGPRPGDPMPDFELPTTDGRTIRKADFVTERPVLITLASMTCPLTAEAKPVLKELYHRFGGRIEFVTVYVREANPSDRYPHPKDLAQKIRHARAYRERDDIPWTVAVDDSGGRLHRLLDGKPNAAYIMALDGTVAARFLRSNDERGLAKALQSVLPKSRTLVMIATGILGALAAGALIRKLAHSSHDGAKRPVPPSARPHASRSGSFVARLDRLGLRKATRVQRDLRRDQRRRHAHRRDEPQG